ncbi:hypothetical protein HDK64DRAFT_259318 [Phyllosticta capitalensis]
MSQTCCAAVLSLFTTTTTTTHSPSRPRKCRRPRTNQALCSAREGESRLFHPPSPRYREVWFAGRYVRNLWRPLRQRQSVERNRRGLHQLPPSLLPSPVPHLTRKS